MSLCSFIQIRLLIFIASAVFDHWQPRAKPQSASPRDVCLLYKETLFDFVCMSLCLLYTLLFSTGLNSFQCMSVNGRPYVNLACVYLWPRWDIGSRVVPESCHSQSEHRERNHLPPSSHLASDLECVWERERVKVIKKRKERNSSCCAALLIISCCTDASGEEYLYSSWNIFRKKSIMRDVMLSFSPSYSWSIWR